MFFHDFTIARPLQDAPFLSQSILDCLSNTGRTQGKTWRHLPPGCHRGGAFRGMVRHAHHRGPTTKRLVSTERLVSPWPPKICRCRQRQALFESTAKATHHEVVDEGLRRRQFTCNISFVACTKQSEVTERVMFREVVAPQEGRPESKQCKFGHLKSAIMMFQKLRNTEQGLHDLIAHSCHRIMVDEEERNADQAMQCHFPLRAEERKSFGFAPC